MNTVTVPRDKVLERVKDNAAKHRAVFDEALVGYREAVITELDKMLADAKAGKRIQRAVALVEPQDHTRDYARVIDMLELSVDDVIELGQDDFARYVRDEWEWQAQFAHSNRAYTKSLAATNYFAEKNL